MGDIKPKPKQPQPDPAPGSDPNPARDSALGEAPGESVSMPDIPGWNAEAPEPTPPPKGYFPPVDFIGAWREWAEAARQAQGAPLPQDAQPPAEDSTDHPAEGFHLPVSNRLLVALTVVGVLVVAGLGGSYYLLFHEGAAEPQPVAVTTPRATPSEKPSARPTFRPSPRPSPFSPAQPPAPAPQSGQRTYTVVAGDTLITIGEQFGVDWHAIAAANGQISDPNLIFPGQVLKIP